MGGKRQKAPEMRSVILLVRPAESEPSWWSKDDSGEFRFAAIDPYDPPSWSLCIDSDCEFDSVELWKQLKCTVEDHVEVLKEDWNEEYGVDEDGDGATWEFVLRDINDQGELVA
jgi:hypothetical protein